MRDRAIIGGMVPNHYSRARQQQPFKMLCHFSSSKAVGHPLTACLVERYVPGSTNLSEIQHCMFSVHLKIS